MLYSETGLIFFCKYVDVSFIETQSSEFWINKIVFKKKWNDEVGQKNECIKLLQYEMYQ